MNQSAASEILRGRRNEFAWVFGGVEKATESIFAVVVEKKKSRNSKKINN